MGKPFMKKCYLALTLDPVHIGTGGYRLGRVDNTIVREPGTNLPKIPGTSISGVTRAYTAMAIQNENMTAVEKADSGWVIDYEKYRNWKYQRPKYEFCMVNNEIKRDAQNRAILKPGTDGPKIEKDENKRDIYYSCAGKGIDDGEGHCGEPDCPVCVSFGFSKGKTGSSFQGLAQFFDARILFFPVHSMLGPIWITCPSLLGDFKESWGDQDGSQIETISCLSFNDDEVQTDLIEAEEKLNLGWMLLKNKSKLSPISGSLSHLDESVLKRLVLVSDRIFPGIVNSNLEVRTSVAIDPATGAAVDGALYSYEAIPRTTVVWFDVIYNKPGYFRIKQKDEENESQLVEKPIITASGKEADWTWVKTNVERGLSLIGDLGVGGMGTRGMGRVRILNIGGCDE